MLKSKELKSVTVEIKWRFYCDPGATRTHGQWLKRPLLYQLSYGINTMPKCGGKVTAL